MHSGKSKTNSFTNRGQHFGNIWTSFSFKLKSDVHLRSDIELGYWLLKLEFDPYVVRYELHPLPRLISCPQPRKVELTAEVMTRDGVLEWHLLCPPRHLGPPVLREIETYANSVGVKLRLFRAEDIEPHKRHILALLKACACLSSWHDVDINYETYHGVVAFVRKHKRGFLTEIFHSSDSQSASLTCYLIARLYSEGVLNVDVLPGFFDHAAGWEAL
jgi:hypothetical protein